MINVVCVLQSINAKLYNPEWVYKLERAVARNLSVPYTFCCYSDVPLACNYKLIHPTMAGWWSKLELFNKNICLNNTLYLDLDVIISKPIDELVSNLQKSVDQFYMCYEPGGYANSSIMFWKDCPTYLYDMYMLDPNLYHEKYKKLPLLGDQGFISDHIKHTFIEKCASPGFVSWTTPTLLNNTTETGLIVFTSKKSKPSSPAFTNNEIIKSNWY